MIVTREGDVVVLRLNVEAGTVRVRLTVDGAQRLAAELVVAATAEFKPKTDAEGKYTDA